MPPRLHPPIKPVKDYSRVLELTWTSAKYFSKYSVYTICLAFRFGFSYVLTLALVLTMLDVILVVHLQPICNGLQAKEDSKGTSKEDSKAKTEQEESKK